MKMGILTPSLLTTTYRAGSGTATATALVAGVLDPGQRRRVSHGQAGALRVKVQKV